MKAGSVLPNVANALEGTTPGVSVTTSSGAPGAGVILESVVSVHFLIANRWL